MKRLRFRASLRDQQRMSIAAQRHLAMSAPPEKREAAMAFVEQQAASIPQKRAYTKRTVANGPSEHQIQAAVIQWWAAAHKSFNLPKFSLFAIPNGGARDTITGARLKAEGVRPGSPDLMLAVRRDPCAGLFIEMKIHPNKLTDNQQKFQNYLIDAGYSACSCWTAEDAIQMISCYIKDVPPF